MNVIVEFLCESDQVEPGRIYKPKEEGTGSGLGAFNVRGAHLVTRAISRPSRPQRLHGGGLSRVDVRVANILCTRS